MLCILLLLILTSTCLADTLPVVDLGYSLHRANLLDGNPDVYNFSNIRYAAPPVGDLRFRAPVSPAINRTSIQDGLEGHICPQAVPIWQSEIAPAFLQSLETGSPFSLSTNISSYPYVPAPMDPRASEDCLFLDVVVPKTILDRRNQIDHPNTALAPVLVWVFGGGYITGDKSSYDPKGLIQRSMVTGEGIVYVAFNYRLGAFGWLPGKTLSLDGTPNSGLHDQRFALQWIQKYIHLFGGDATRVTVMGESAGGGSIMHQITAFGGDAGPAPFQQAIVQSPGWTPVIQDEQQEEIFQLFLDILGVNTIEEARQLSSEQLIGANSYLVSQAPYGSTIFTPVVDGSFAPALPGQLLLEGRFDWSLNIMVGHNSDEGLIFTSPDGFNSSFLIALLKRLYPNIRASDLNYISQVLYPPVYDGSYGYGNAFERVDLLISDWIFVCNTAYLNSAYRGQTHAYEFSIPPGIHGQDVLYTFYINGSSGVLINDSGLSVVNSTAAYVLQDYETSFMQTGTPSSSLGPVFPKHGYPGQLMEMGINAIDPHPDPTNNARCRYWQRATYAM